MRWPRNALRGLPLHKVDIRLSHSIKAGGMTLTLMAEVFDLFNWKNYGSSTRRRSVSRRHHRATRMRRARVSSASAMSSDTRGM